MPGIPVHHICALKWTPGLESTCLLRHARRMAYDDKLAGRVAAVLTEQGTAFDTMRMMGGLCYMVDDKMRIGIKKDQLMARVGPDAYEECLEQQYCRPMHFTGRPLKGFVYVDLPGFRTRKQLTTWVQRALDFNPLAKASKKRKC